MQRSYRGLSGSAVCESREKYGANSINTEKTQTFWDKYWACFNDPIITVLMVALCANVLFVFLGKVEWIEAAGILLAVLISTFVSAFSEYKSEETFRDIQRLADNITCKVFREGNLCEIPIDDIVVGDFVLLQNGDMIPADGIVTEGSLHVSQLALCGENKEFEKSESGNDMFSENDLWDEHSLYRGSIVTSGECVMEVKRVGSQTLSGKLTVELSVQDRKSPLMLKLTKLAKSISLFGYVSGGTMVLMYMLQRYAVVGASYLSDYATLLSDFTEALILGIIVIVVAVPEGLPLMIAIVCSLNMKKMFKDNVLVRKLVGIETAGSLNILFTDKTGTVTKGELEAVSFLSGDMRMYNRFSDLSGELKNLVTLSIHENTSSRISNGKAIGGNVTEKALMNYIMNNSAHLPGVVRRKQEPFNSDVKYSYSEVTGAYNLTLIKGAPEIILKRCGYYYDINGAAVKLNNIYNLENEINKMAKKAIRVIAFAASKESVNEDGVLPNNLILVGLIGIRDEVRREAASAIREVQNAGVSVVMITGDKKETAVAIAKESGILQGSCDVAITGEELSRLSDDEVKCMMERLKVVARALPNDKSRLVRLAQEMDLVAGMTGDGINDTPALKTADVGFAMGSGTSASKEAGDIVILDDNFLSIKKAILYGRTIYNNVKKFIKFQMTVNIAAVSISVIGSYFGITKPLDITQMLWINLVMDTLGAIAFGSEPSLNKYLKEKPKNRADNIVDKKTWQAVIINGLFICFLSLVFFKSDAIHELFRKAENDIYVYTGYFSFFVLACVINGFNARVDGVNIFEYLSLNKNFLRIMGCIGIVQLFMTYHGGAILRTQGLTAGEWFVVLGLALLIIPVDLIRKILTS